jgi:hypothetical protein
MFFKALELSFRDSLLEVPLKGRASPVEKGSYNVSRNVLHLVEMENLFGLLL